MATSPCPPGESLLMFLDGVLSVVEHAAIAVHLEACPTCRETLQFHTACATLLRDSSETPWSPEEPCPPAWLLVQYHMGALTDDMARRLRGHLLLCDACFTEVLDLAQAQHNGVLLPIALSHYVQQRRARPGPAVLAAAGTSPTTVLASIEQPPGASVSLPLDIVYGPSLSEAGHFAVNLRLPATPDLAGKAVLLRLRFAPYVFEIQGRVEQQTISIDHTFPQGAPPELAASVLREALLHALEVHILDRSDVVAREHNDARDR